jgi:hypothetical protein
MERAAPSVWIGEAIKYIKMLKDKPPDLAIFENEVI